MTFKSTVSLPIRLLIAWPPDMAKTLRNALRRFRQQQVLEWVLASPNDVRRRFNQANRYDILVMSGTQFSAWDKALHAKIAKATSLVMLMPNKLPLDLTPEAFTSQRATVACSNDVPLTTCNEIIAGLIKTLASGHTFSQAMEAHKRKNNLWVLAQSDVIWWHSEKPSRAPKERLQRHPPQEKYVKRGGNLIDNNTTINIQNAQIGDNYNYQMGDVGYQEIHSDSGPGNRLFCKACKKDSERYSSACLHCGEPF